LKQLEHKLQCACIKWFRLQYPRYFYHLFAIPNGGSRDVITGSKLKAEGVVAGVADLFLCIANTEFHGLFIELKTEDNHQSIEQKKFEDAVKKVGYKYVVIKRFDDFVDLINDYLNARY
jgi:hypothetical protein